jgi:hypothetical protein
MNIYSLLDFLKRERLGGKKLKIRNKGNRKKTLKIIFWNFKDQKV